MKSGCRGQLRSPGVRRPIDAQVSCGLIPRFSRGISIVCRVSKMSERKGDFGPKALVYVIIVRTKRSRNNIKLSMDRCVAGSTSHCRTVPNGSLCRRNNVMLLRGIAESTDCYGQTNVALRCRSNGALVIAELLDAEKRGVPKRRGGAKYVLFDSIVPHLT